MLLHLIASASPLKPEFWLQKAGASALWMVAAIIFAESGLFFGFFFPGDSLLFMMGFLTSSAAAEFARQNGLDQVVAHIPPLWVVWVVLFIAAVAGDQVGYLFGLKAGPSLFSRPDSRLFKQSHVTKAHAFLEKNGPKTVLLARFIPIVRTFTPIVAGVGRMRYRTFFTYNVLGGFIWAVGLTTLGHFLGQIEFFRKNIEYTILAVIFISLIPVFIEVIRHRRNPEHQPDPQPGPTA